eukprot:1226564-Rhodomonas_salina.1
MSLLAGSLSADDEGTSRPSHGDTFSRLLQPNFFTILTCIMLAHTGQGGDRPTQQRAAASPDKVLGGSSARARASRDCTPPDRVLGRAPASHSARGCQAQ